MKNINFFFIHTLIGKFIAIGLLLPALNSAIQAQEPCMTENMHNQKLYISPQYQQKVVELEKKTANWIKKNSEEAGIRSVAIIPVVVHIIWHDKSENLSTLQVLSQIDALNADFRLRNSNSTSLPASFGLLPADCEIEFCLAKNDPNGNMTSGITRTLTADSCIGQTQINGQYAIHYTQWGGIDAWDPHRYLNIWVGNLCGPLGRSSYPYQAGEAEDGIVIDPAYFGTISTQYPWHLGRTTTHEVGHYLGLRHIWGASTETCDDDGVNDTPLQQSYYFGCPSHPQVSCGTEDLFMNYMNYTDDKCMNHFTEGQKMKMKAALQVARPQLINENNCADYYFPLDSTLEYSDNQYTLFPNPTTGFFHIRANALVTGEAVVSIYATSGAQLYRETYFFRENRPIDISNLVSGLYIIEISINKQISHQKLILYR